jgi:flavin reductase (DIM6/NTAB) family NADH-FMN oxidoreductase RutF
MLCTWVARINRNPPFWLISLNKKHLTTETILKTKKYTLNFAKRKLAQKVDYIGLHSGRTIDKSAEFDTFFGNLGVPMINECSFNLEIVLRESHEYPDHYTFIGEAKGCFVDSSILSNEEIQVENLDPLVYIGAKGNPSYWGLGSSEGQAFKIGREHTPQKE